MFKLAALSTQSVCKPVKPLSIKSAVSESIYKAFSHQQHLHSKAIIQKLSREVLQTQIKGIPAGRA